MAKEEVKDKDTQDNPAGIDAKYLAGLKFHGATPKEVMKDGRKKMEYIPYERPLEPGDVMSHKDYGATVVIATKDGRKYTVAKKGK